MMPPQDLVAKIRPELRGKIYESVIRHIDSPVHKHRLPGAACRRVIEIGEPCAQRAAAYIIEIEHLASAILSNDQRAAYGIAGSRPERVSAPHAKVARIFMKRRGDDEVPEEILRRDIRHGRSKALGKSTRATSIFGIGMSYPREYGIECAPAQREQAGGLMHEIVPFLSCGDDRR